MRKIGIDFGTGNTVIAIWNETLGAAETLAVPHVSTPLRYRLSPAEPEHEVSVIPSMIHYTDTEVLIGDQVLSRGLAEHPGTFRFMKREIGAGNTRRRKVPKGVMSPDGFKNNAEAAGDFLRLLLLRNMGDRVEVAEDEFTFTAPCEAFENYQDWLRTVAEQIGMKRMRFLDEPTACVLGYHGTARRDEVFAVFDFGCGTLDVSIVRIDLAATEERKAVQLGQSGDDLGGMDLDRWLAEDFCARQGLDDAARRELDALILRHAEEVKIALSDPATNDAEMLVLDDRGPVPRSRRVEYTRTCRACQAGQAGRHAEADSGCLGCLLLANDFLKRTQAVLERALENAAIKGAIRRTDLTRVLVTGGTSLVPAVRAMLDAYFPGKVEYQSPFDAVARGACRGIVVPILQHDYAIESYNSQSRAYEFKTLFPIGTEYPTKNAVRLWANIAFDGQTRLAPKIFEVSQVRKRMINGSVFDEKGNVKAAARVATDHSYLCLNESDLTYITPDPPVVKARDARRFHCTFRVDGHRRLLLTVLDHHTGKELLTEHPVVRL